MKNRSTILGIGCELFKKIHNTKFCIVGCGGVGTNFAEMLVRSGATKISLIDADNIESKNLNRTPFTAIDIGKNKAKALSDRLYSINKRVNITAMDRCFGEYSKGDHKRQEVRDLVVKSDVTIIAVDKNNIRLMCEELRNNFHSKYLVIGVKINYESKTSGYACGWMTKTNLDEKDLEGYGENNGSYMSIVLEATCVGFNMLLHHLENPLSAKFTYTNKEYRNYIPQSGGK